MRGFRVQPKTTIMKTIDFSTYQKIILEDVSFEMYGIDFCHLSVRQSKKVKDAIKADWLNCSESRTVFIEGVLTLVIR